MNFAPILSSLVGAILGAFFGFILQSRNQRIERQNVLNLLIGQVSYVFSTLVHMRLQAEMEFSKEGKLKFSVAGFDETFNKFDEISKNISIYFKLDSKNLRRTLKLLNENNNVNRLGEKVKLYSEEIEISNIKDWFYIFGITWNGYLESMENLISICREIIDQNREMCLLDLKVYDTLVSMCDGEGLDAGKINVEDLPDEFRKFN